jgi:hypothetical protein
MKGLSMNRHSQDRINKLLEETQAATDQGVSKMAIVRKDLLRELLLLLGHWRGLAELPRVATVVPWELPDVSAASMLAGEQDPLTPIVADPPEAPRENYHCCRCHKPFRWQPVVMSYLCAAAENCPACRPLCATCTSEAEVAQHLAPPGVAIPAQRPVLTLISQG